MVLNYYFNQLHRVADSRFIMLQRYKKYLKLPKKSAKIFMSCNRHKKSSEEHHRIYDDFGFLGNESQNYLVVRGKLSIFASQWI